MATASTAKNGASPFRFWQTQRSPRIDPPRRHTKMLMNWKRWNRSSSTALPEKNFRQVAVTNNWKIDSNQIHQKSHHNHHIFHFASQVSKSSWETCQKSAAASGLPAYPPWICAGFRWVQISKSSQAIPKMILLTVPILHWIRHPKENCNLLHYRGDVCKAQSHLLSRGYPTPARPSCHCKGHHPQPELQP